MDGARALTLASTVCLIKRMKTTEASFAQFTRAAILVASLRQVSLIFNGFKLTKSRSGRFRMRFAIADGKKRDKNDKKIDNDKTLQSTLLEQMHLQIIHYTRLLRITVERGSPNFCLRATKVFTQ